MSCSPRRRLSSVRPRVARLIVPLLGSLGTGCEPEEDLGHALYRLNKDWPPTQQVPQPPLLPLPESCFPVNPECDDDTSDVYPFLARDAPDLPLPGLRCARSPSEPTIQELGVYGEPLLCGYTDGSIQTLIRYTYRAIDDCPRLASTSFVFSGMDNRNDSESWVYDNFGRLTLHSRSHWASSFDYAYSHEEWEYDNENRVITRTEYDAGQSHAACVWDRLPYEKALKTTYNDQGVAILGQTGTREYIDQEHAGWVCNTGEWLGATAMVWNDPVARTAVCVEPR